MIEKLCEFYDKLGEKALLSNARAHLDTVTEARIIRGDYSYKW